MTSVSVPREELYELVWSEPMTKVAGRYEVSSSFLARVCTRLHVPRPPRGYWAKLAVGKARPKPPLPGAQPGDELEWSRGGAVPARASRALPEPPDVRVQRAPKATKLRGTHGLIAGAREHFVGSREADSGHLRPTKRRLVDLYVSIAHWTDACALRTSCFAHSNAKAIGSRSRRPRAGLRDQRSMSA
jgi:hypothetical protein